MLIVLIASVEQKNIVKRIFRMTMQKSGFYFVVPKKIERSILSKGMDLF